LIGGPCGHVASRGPPSVAPSVRWQLREEEEAAGLTYEGLTEPVERGAATEIESVEERIDGAEVPPSSRTIEHDEGGNDEPGIPAERTPDGRGDAGLHVEGAERRLRVDDRSLDLDDEQAALRGMERKEVDPAAIAVLIEAHLGSHGPAQCLEASGHARGESGAVGIQEPIDVGALPSDVPTQRQIHGPGDRAGDPDGEPARATAFEHRASGGPHAGDHGEVREPPAASRADGDGHGPPSQAVGRPCLRA